MPRFAGWRAEGGCSVPVIPAAITVSGRSARRAMSASLRRSGARTCRSVPSHLVGGVPRAGPRRLLRRLWPGNAPDRPTRQPCATASLLLRAPCSGDSRDSGPRPAAPPKQLRCSSSPASSVPNLSTRSDASVERRRGPMRAGVVSPGPLRPRDTGGRAGARADLEPARTHPGPPATAAQDPVIPGPGHQPWVLGGAVCHPAPSGRDRRPALRQPPHTRCLLHFELKRCELTRHVEGHRSRSPLTAYFVP